jgi:hypothetical protein
MDMFPELQTTDDSTYLGETYLALNDTLRWLKGSNSGWGPDNLLRICQEMASETPCTPAWKTNETPLILAPGGEFAYRRPVWEALGTQIDKVNGGGPPLSSLQAKANWLIDHLQTCRKLREYSALLDHFQDSVTKLGLAVRLRSLGQMEPDVLVSGSFKPRAEVITMMVVRVIEGLLPQLTEMIKKKSA